MSHHIMATGKSEIIQLRLGLSNAFVIRGARNVLVDVGSHHSTRDLLQALQRENISVKDISLILHTHGHSDHCAGSRDSRQTIAAPVAIHRADAQMLRSGMNSPLIPTRLSGKLLKPLVDRRIPGTEPDILITEETSLEAYGIDARVIFTPGHTPGSISVITGAEDAIVGDIMMGGHLGGILFPNQPRHHYFADNLDQVNASIKKIMEQSPKKIYVGHGGPLNPEDVLQRFSREVHF